MALYPASDQFLVAAPTVGVRAVKKIDADLKRAAQGFRSDPAQHDRCLKPARQLEPPRPARFTGDTDSSAEQEGFELSVPPE